MSPLVIGLLKELMENYTPASLISLRRRMSRRDTLLSEESTVIPDMFTIEFSTEGIEMNPTDLQGKTIDIDFHEVDTGIYDMLAQWVSMQCRNAEKSLCRRRSPLI